VICQKKLYGKRATAGGTPQTPSFGVTFADVYFGRDKAILKHREKITRKTLDAKACITATAPHNQTNQMSRTLS
jgi:hypothetical protein